jgi:glutamine synthetase
MLNLLEEATPQAIYGPESSEFRIIPDLKTFEQIPYSPDNGRFICELSEIDGRPAQVDTRYYLRRILEKAGGGGYKVMAACEPEFNLYLVQDAKIVAPFIETYGSPLGTFTQNAFLQELVSSLVAMETPVERYLKEGGPAFFEVQMRYANGLKAADDMVTLRTAAKCIARKHGVNATFLPKPMQLGGHPGAGMHVHLSLWDSQEKRNLFGNPNDARQLGLSETAYYFIGGVLEHLKSLCLLCAPLVNSYKRLLDGSVAPSRVFYGGDHRDAAVRVPSQDPSAKGSSARIEFRVSDCSANPYLVIGSIVDAGLYGIEHKLDPGSPIRERVFELTEAERKKLGVGTDKYLPRTLGEAIAEFKKSSFLRKSLGDELFEGYLQNREYEWKAFREHVTDWEIYKFIDIF